MEVWLPLKIALRALRANKSRSFLTMLGIIIGIGAVIVMVAVGTGASKQIEDQIASMGSNLILILPGSTTSGGVRAGSGAQPTLTLDDARALRAECPAIARVSPQARGTAQVVYANMNWSTLINGVAPDFFSIREWGVAAGRLLEQAETDAAHKVCLLGATVADTLFGEEDPLGKSVRIKGSPFTVVGVMEAKGRSAQGQDQDDVVFTPVNTAIHKLFGSPFPNTVGAIMVQAVDQGSLDAALAQAQELLDQRHRIGPAKERDFTVRNLSEILAVAQQSSRTMALLLGAVASVSLVVGGIGIMNIMLVSVTERTREIGVRIAIGAKQRDIMQQFLTEAVLLTLMGGVVGILLGSASSVAVARLLGWPSHISTQAIVVAVAFSSAVGVFFGYYPARKAANLDPIDALRYE